jgi:hypothetical protein
MAVNFEGINIRNIQAVMVNTGVSFHGSTDPGQFTVNDGHINFLQNGVIASNVYALNIARVLFFQNENARPPFVNQSIGISFLGCQYCTATNNQFLQQGSVAFTNILWVGNNIGTIVSQNAHIGGTHGHLITNTNVGGAILDEFMGATVKIRYGESNRTAIRDIPSAAPSATYQMSLKTDDCGIFNVSSVPWEAVGDGVHDDSTAVNAAMVAAAKAATTNKCCTTVYFPEGIFILQNVELLQNVTVQGAGAGATVLMQKPGFGPSDFLTDRTGHAFGGATILFNSYPNQGYNGNQPLTGIIIRDLTLDGNCWNQNLTQNSWNVYLNSVIGALIENVVSKNSLNHGFTLKSSTSGVIRGSVAISNGQNLKSLGDGFNLQAHSTDNLVTHCNSSNNTGEGFEVALDVNVILTPPCIFH